MAALGPIPVPPAPGCQVVRSRRKSSTHAQNPPGECSRGLESECRAAEGSEIEQWVVGRCGRWVDEILSQRALARRCLLWHQALWRIPGRGVKVERAAARVSVERTSADGNIFCHADDAIARPSRPPLRGWGGEGFSAAQPEGGRHHLSLLNAADFARDWCTEFPSNKQARGGHRSARCSGRLGLLRSDVST